MPLSHGCVRACRQIHELVREPNTAGKYGEVWHHDCSYMRQPPLGALLYGVEVPPYGNDTVFASMYLAYEALSPDFRRMIEPLHAVHTAFKKVEKDPQVRHYSKRTPHEAHHKAAAGTNRRGRVALCVGQASYLPYDEVTHPVVRLHPETGRKALFVNSFFTKRFVGKATHTGSLARRQGGWRLALEGSDASLA